MDNLHPSEYLFPILSADSRQLVELMRALTGHLKPAPYPFGLLCMRLLGKMGGVNRLFLRELGSFEEDPQIKKKRISGRGLAMFCEWPEKEKLDNSFLLPFPLARAVDVLRCVASAPCIVLGDGDGNQSSESRNDKKQNSPSSLDPYQCKNFGSLLPIDAQKINLNLFCVKRMEEVKHSQTKSAFVVLRAALASVLDMGQGEKDRTDEQSRRASICIKDKRAAGNQDKTGNEVQEGATLALMSQQYQHYNDDFRLICDGLFAATVHEDLHEEAMLLVRGLGAHIFYFTVSNRANITKINSDGCAIDPFHDEDGRVVLDNGQFDSQDHIIDGKLQPLKPFGCFRLSDPFANNNGTMRIDPFVFNESLSGAFTDAEVENSHRAAMAVMCYIIELFHKAKVGAVASTERNTKETIPRKDSMSGTNTSWGDVLFENLLSKLCQSCFRQTWNLRPGAMTGLFKLITNMGRAWSQQYEVEILHCALSCVKDTPNGIFQASKDSMRFFLQISWFFFGGPASWIEKTEGSGDKYPLIHDVLCPTMSNKYASVAEEAKVSMPSIKKASLTLILSEIASTKPLVRCVYAHEE